MNNNNSDYSVYTRTGYVPICYQWQYLILFTIIEELITNAKEQQRLRIGEMCVNTGKTEHITA